MSKVCSLISKKSPNCESGLVRILKASKTPKTLWHYLRSLRIRPVPEAMQCRPEGSGGLTIAYDQGPFVLQSRPKILVPSRLFRCTYLDMHIYIVDIYQSLLQVCSSYMVIRFQPPIHGNLMCIFKGATQPLEFHLMCTELICILSRISGWLCMDEWLSIAETAHLHRDSTKVSNMLSISLEGMISWRALQSHKSVAVSAVFLL